MVVDVSSRQEYIGSIDEFFHQVDLEVNESIHEFEYSLLLDKYNYLQENGVVMEEAEENNAFKSKIKRLIGIIIQKVKDVWAWIKKKFKTIKSKVTGDKKKKIEQAEAETDKEAKETIDQLNAEAKDPTENSGKKSHGIFNIFKKKQEKKAKEFNFDEEAYSDTMQPSDIKIWLKQYLKKDSSFKAYIIYPKAVPDDDEITNRLLDLMHVSKDADSIIGVIVSDPGSYKDFKIVKTRRWEYAEITPRLQQELENRGGSIEVIP